MHTIIRDDYTPQLNEYHEIILVDPTRKKTWLFDCDGVFTDITKINVVSERGDSTEYAASQDWLTRELEALEAADIALQDNIDAEAATREADDKTLQDNIDNEESERIAADTEIWDEIEALEAASDVVDIVGTYAELENYDTSALKDNDIIKVLQDETHDDAIAYYRWDTATDTFTFVGVEGPYYTASETDALLAGKQDKLIAGSNIQIAADGKTISATDTTYSAMTGATSSVAGTSGLVPAPAAGDNTKFLGGDGAWKTIPVGTTFYYDSNSIGGIYEDQVVPFYKDSSLTQPANNVDIYNAFEYGRVLFVDAYDGDGYGPMEVFASDYYARFFTFNSFNPSERIEFWYDDVNRFIVHTVTYQESLTAGSNITISDNTISATDTTYTAGTGISIDANNVISATSTAALYGTTGQNTDGAMTQKAVTDTLFENNDTARIKIGSGVTNSGAASIVIGSQGTQVLTPNSIAIGNGGTTAGSSGGSGNNVAIGSYGISATGGQSVAIGGYGALAKAEAAIAIGSGGAEASGVNSIAIGRTTMASHKDSVALGTNAVTGRTSEISLGTNASGINPEKTKYIAHVTAGVNGTDAVNVAQLNAAIPGAMTGATSSAAGTSGLVPAPAAGDDVKYLAGDGTWKTVSAGSVTMFYNNFDSTMATMYSDSAMTTAVKGEDVESAFNQGKVIICCVSSGGNRYIEATGLLYYSWNTSLLIVETALRSDRVLFWFTYADKATTSCNRTSQTLQSSFTLGSNLSWSGNTINATDTTYSDFGGATSSSAGTSGLVPAPAVGDEDKYLKGDGTWAVVSGGPQITMTDTDPGEGGTLAADNYIFVYDGGGNA